MKKHTIKTFILLLALLLVSLALTSCYGHNYPGNEKSKYWVSEDGKIIFWFSAEAGHGKAEGDYIEDENTISPLILEWNTKNGVVEVKTAGYEKIFTANTTTDPLKLICTFEIISQEEGYNFPNKIIFHWEETRN